MPVIDAHHHFWELARFPYHWLVPDAPAARFGDKAAIRRDVLPPDYLAETASVDLVGSVHVQANCGAADPVDETRWLHELARTTGWPSAIVAEVDLSDPGATRLIDDHAAASNRLRGVRTPVAWDAAGRWRVANAPHRLADPAFRIAARHLAGLGLVLEMVVVPAQLSEVADLAAALPDLTIVINHFATLEPDQPGNGGQWRAGIDRIAACANVTVKVSGLWTADRTWTPSVLTPYLSHALTTLGSARLMYGSNLPVEGVNCGFDDQIASLSQILAGQGQPIIRDLFHHTARRIYRLR